MPNWTSDQLKKLRGYYASLLRQSETFSQQKKDPYIREGAVQVVADEIGRIAQDFPDLLPPLPLDRLHYNNVRDYYDLLEFKRI